MTGTSSSQASTMATGRIILILGMLAGFAPLATDMYLAGFHLMADDFSVAEGGVEVTLSVFFLGLAIGQAVYGPLIDRFGRRGPLLAGIAVFIGASALCMLTSDIRAFTALRFLQAAGGCAGMIIGRAVVSDLFDAVESARALSLLMVVMTLAPIVAPILGGFVIAHFGWRAVFLVMLAFGLLCAILVWLFIPETLERSARQKAGFVEILKNWAALFIDRRFLVPAVVGGLGQACMFAFITGSPFVFVTLHGASTQTYGMLFAVIACALIVSAQANRIALRRFSPRILLGFALVVNVVAGIVTVAAVSTGSLILLLIPLWLAIGSIGFIGANAAAVAMAATGSQAGSGSSLVGVMQFGLAFLVSSLVAALQNGTAYPMTIAISVSGMLAAAIWFRLARDRDPPTDYSR